MAQLVQVTKQADDIRRLFAVNQQRMVRASPKGFDPNRLLAIAFNAIVYNTDLLDCTRESLIGGAFEALKLGLTLGGPMQEAWLIPFKNRKKDGNEWITVKEATFIVGYMGYRVLVDRARSTLDMQPRAVHNGIVAGALDGKTKRPGSFSPGTPDEFDYFFGDTPRILHKPKNPSPEWKEQLRAVYIVANLRGGGKQLEVLEVEEVEQHRNRSRAKDNGPWVTDYVPMGLKTAVRKIAKYLPKCSLELSRAMDLDNRADAGEPQQFDLDGLIIPEPEVSVGTAAPPTRALEGFKEKLRTAGAPTDADLQAPPAQPLTADEINWGSS
jgi:recombination protein RecT